MKTKKSKTSKLVFGILRPESKVAVIALALQAKPRTRQTVAPKPKRQSGDQSYRKGLISLTGITSTMTILPSTNP